jgi:hypothetical protein
MKTADLSAPASSVIPVKRKRTVKRAAEPVPGSFVNTEPMPIDAPMWPLHAALWFQPELAPTVPAWSDLAIERRHRAPAAEFLFSGTAPLNRRDVVETSHEARLPETRPQIPESTLTPFGWDPRVLAGNRKEGQ